MSSGFFARLRDDFVDCATEAGHLGYLASESAMHAAIQDPIDASEQLLNHISKPLTGYELPPLHLIDAPPPAKFGSADWAAKTIGIGLGKAADVMLVATGLGGRRVASLPQSALSEAVLQVVSATLRLVCFQA